MKNNSNYVNCMKKCKRCNRYKICFKAEKKNEKKYKTNSARIHSKTKKFKILEKRHLEHHKDISYI